MNYSTATPSSYKDRTKEFQAIVESILSRSSTPLGGSSSDGPINANTTASSSAKPKTEFAIAAAQISREITGIVAKLGRLMTLAKSKSLFDDKPMEINELIYVVKQDIAKVNKQISQLAEYYKGHRGAVVADTSSSSLNNKQTAEHGQQVITSLQSKLASTSNEFKAILELRTSNMREQKSRRDQFNFTSPSLPVAATTGTTASTAPPPTTYSLPMPGLSGTATGGGPSTLSILSQRSIPTSSASQMFAPSSGNSRFAPQAEDHVIDFTGVSNEQQSLLLQEQPNVSASASTREYLDSRSSAIESIESTIAELGQIYATFTTLLSAQRESVQRIDENVEEMAVNVEGAHTQLMRYYQGISNNRTLMLQMFGVLIVFFLIFIMMT